ncbi:MAG: hypothetical protein ACUZ8N_14580 [Candidatus Scalindua sp.]
MVKSKRRKERGKIHRSAPRLPASLLGGDKQRPCPSGRRGGQVKRHKFTLMTTDYH